MAPQQRQRQQRTTASAFLLLPCLLVLVLSPLKAAGATSSAFSCMAELEACDDDETCHSCLVSWPVGDSLSTCTEYSTEAAEPAVEAEVDSCQETGAQNCCGFVSGTAETCMENALLDAFWACILETTGCSLEDMPCSIAGVTAAAGADADAAADAENAAPFGGPPFWACRYGAGAFAAVTIAFAAAGL